MAKDVKEKVAAEATQAEVKESQLAPAKDKKEVQKAKKPNFFKTAPKKIAKWFRELKSEAKKVVWPNGKTVLNNTLVVIIMVVIVGVFVYLLDFTFGFIRDLIARLV